MDKVRCCMSIEFETSFIDEKNGVVQLPYKMIESGNCTHCSKLKVADMGAFGVFFCTGCV